MQLKSFRIMHHRNIGVVETVCLMATLTVEMTMQFIDSAHMVIAA
ncbi:hypothetical protein T229_05345 [Tannerella sp. oral taxon BU063 isolate Cell 5]|uniref:Uncharacterized protein n=2 Tax=Tannerella serpentiformis TaxID=712710 RepID=W2CF50_9BACT|nr:hypothetical protein T229_05345 [Tannerella sp. oral taxon BU063 isolate Cell 5]ETK11752.1 hypothetical protein T235_13775 [Tannerella sp. oral taxon BU063 isolate Cell 8/11]